MNRIRKFLGLSPMDRRLVMRAALVLITIRIAATTLAFGSLRRILARAAQAPWLLGANAPAGKISWAVAVASRYTPITCTCLVQALAVQALMARASQPAHLRFGVAQGVDGGVEAHAWVEYRERVIIGGPVTPQYVELVSVERQGLDTV